MPRDIQAIRLESSYGRRGIMVAIEEKQQQHIKSKKCSLNILAGIQ